MNEISENTLTAEQKLAVQEYVISSLSKWLKLFGFASLGALALAFASTFYYTFFVLPGQAVESAKNQLQEEIAAVAGELTQKLTDHLESAGESKERIAALQRQTDNALEQYKTIQTALLEVNESTLTESAKFVAQLKDAEQLSDLVKRIESVENKKLCYCVDARHNGNSCSEDGKWTSYKGDGKTPDRIKVYFCN